MKRSSQVALLLMGMTTAGASAYALLPPRDCAAPGSTTLGTISPQTLAPGTAQAKPLAPCDSSGRSSGSRSYWSSRSYSRGSSSTPQQSREYSGHSPSQSHTSVPSVGHGPGTRGGFGSIGHSIAAERPDWRARAEEIGFDFHTLGGQRYWDERAYYAFMLKEIEQDLEAPTAELENMSRELVARIIADERLMRRLAIPVRFWNWIARSWKKSEPSLYGRFDLRYGGDGPAKLLEYNADTPTSVLETGVFQWMWLEQGIERKALPKDADQFNSVHERLIQGWKEIGKSRHPAEDQLAAIRTQCSGNGLIPCCIILGNPIREIEGGKEIQEGKARSPGAQEEGDEEGEAGQESKG